MSRHKKDPSQKEQERFQKMLDEILRLPGNDNCADCGQKGPRWASVNLGIFVCIRCSGIHRNMGTHISKVKSVSLDKWQTENIEQVRLIGNTNSRRIYEGRLPPNHHRPRDADAYAIEQWIRDKYDRKRWYDSDAAAAVLCGQSKPAQATAPDNDERRQHREERKRQREQEKVHKQQATTSQAAAELFNFSEPARQAPPAQATPVPAQPETDFFAAFQSTGPAASASTSASVDFFGSGAAQGQAPQGQQATQMAPPPSAGSSKDQIMSLFKAQAMPQANAGQYQMGNMQGQMMGGMPQQTGNMQGQMMGNGMRMGNGMQGQGQMMGSGMQGQMQNQMMGTSMQGNQWSQGQMGGGMMQNQMRGNMQGQGQMMGNGMQGQMQNQMMGAGNQARGNMMQQQTPQNMGGWNNGSQGGSSGFQW